MQLNIQKEVKTIGGWPTDTVSIDYVPSKKKNKHNGANPISDDAPQQPHDIQTNSICCPHTLLLFVPGNPGCVGWYTKLLYSIIEQLGTGYAARGVSYAGHGVGEHIVNRPSSAASASSSGEEKAINAHSVDGQVHHKILWMDRILQTYHASWEGKQPNIIFLSHSIGAHLVQRLCVLRSDFLSRVLLVMHLMPFIRFDPSLASQSVPLSVLAHAVSPAVTILETVARVASNTPKHALDWLLKNQAGVHDKEGRDLAVELCRNPVMARNFLMLGLEEVRTLPEVYDDSAMRIIGAQCATSMLYCGGPDQWAPATHLADMTKLQQTGHIPKNITVEYMEHLKHDFVVNPNMVPHVSDFCVRSVLNHVVVNEDDYSDTVVVVTDGMERKPTSSFPRSRL